MEISFTVNDFEGPLDLLLHLVRTSEVDIYEISTLEIIEQYLSFIRSMESININVASEYLVMASELVHLKSKLLINQKDESGDSEFGINSEEDLKQRILEYEKYKLVSEEFKRLEIKRSEYYTKAPSSLEEYIVRKEIVSGTMDVEDLLNAFLKMQERLIGNKPLSTKITRKELSVVERINTIKEKLSVKNKMNFIELFDDVNNEYIIVTFLAILEMSKNKEIKITQKNSFENIVLERWES